MKITKIVPRGYCYGVFDAIKIANEAANDENVEKPIYILGMLVHNKNVIDAFSDIGVITLDNGKDKRSDLLQKVDKGTVIFTAHGVSPEVYEIAKNKNLNIIDATCPDVTKTHNLIKKNIKKGYDFIYIGKKNHPEPEGAVGIDPKRVHLVEDISDLENLKIDNSKIMITNQTTMSLWDVAKISDRAKEIYPNATYVREICNATRVRQEAVYSEIKDNNLDFVIVVGDPKSNNSNKLVQIAKENNIDSLLLSEFDQLKDIQFYKYNHVGVTSGASTPTQITNEVIKWIENYNKDEKISTYKIKEDIKILPKVKKRG